MHRDTSSRNRRKPPPCANCVGKAPGLWIFAASSIYPTTPVILLGVVENVSRDIGRHRVSCCLRQEEGGPWRRSGAHGALHGQSRSGPRKNASPAPRQRCAVSANSASAPPAWSRPPWRRL